MKELEANLWEALADLRCVTTNGYVTGKGARVMGRGCALEAKRMIPGVEYRLGGKASEHGNRPMRLCRARGADLASFPVKHHWREAVDPELIERGARSLVELVQKFGYRRVILPRSGCGNGSLSWEWVRQILEGLLDDRFTVVNFPKRP